MVVGFIGQDYIGKNYANDFENRGYSVACYVLEEPYTRNKDLITSSWVLSQPSREELEPTLRRELNRYGGELHEEMHGIHEKVARQESLVVLGSSLYTVYTTLHES